MHHILRQFGRFILVGLFIFEFLNLVKILHFSLDFTWLGLMITSGMALIIIESISFFLKKHTGKPVLGLVYFMASISVLADAAGDVFHIYSSYEHTDQILHFLGGGCVAICIFSVVKAYNDAKIIKLSRFSQIFYPICVASFMGTLYEIEEYTEDIFFHTNRLGDGYDTANDLLLNNTGALFFCLLVYIIITRFKKAAG